jgi:hypothetical protein
MHPVYRPFRIALAAILLLWGCNVERIDRHPDSYVVVKHTANGEKYVIRHDNLVIEAVCKNSIFSSKNDGKIHATHCLTSMPVGTEVTVTKDVGDSLYADWKEANINWQMHLSIEKEELRGPNPVHASVWAITIATFLGTLVAVLGMLFISSRRKQIREALREHRIEKRMPTEVGVELSSLHQPSFYENAITENVGRHGARIVAMKPWRPNDQVLVTLPGYDRTTRARIAYCNPLPRDAFAIGLQFLLVVDWETPRPEIPDYKLSIRLYRK